MELGGRATKLGNTYERLWAVRQALYVIEGRCSSLLWEPVGDDESGIDLWVTNSDGSRIGYQLKRQNRDKEYWSVSDLRGERVLEFAREQLERDSQASYVFVSSCGVRFLRDLAEQSQRANDDPVIYYRDLVCVNKERKKAFHELMSAWSLDPNDPANMDLAFRMLQRMTFEIQERSNRTRDEIEFASGLLIDGDSAQVVATLGDFLDDHLGKQLHADDFRNALQDHGFRFRRLAGDPSLPTAIEHLQQRFDSIISQDLIAGAPIQRPEVTDLLAKIRGNQPPRIVFVHGYAGSGKSVAVQQLYGELARAGIPCLPIQLHCHRPEGTPNNYGRLKLALPASPALSLRGHADRRHAVLILDQLDALRLTSIHSHESWDACAAMIDEALADAQTTVVVACRTFDLENDPKIAAWKRAMPGAPASAVVDMKIGELPEAAVVALLRKVGVDFASLPARQQSVLRQPAPLSLWWNLSQAGRSPLQFENATQLMREFLRLRREEAQRDHGVAAGDLEHTLTSLVAYMDREGRLDAPAAMLSNYGCTTSALCSVGILRSEGGSLSFVHQGYFDHLVAERVVAETLQDGPDPLEWVKSNQSLFRRDQLRQLLTLVRDSEGPRHEALIRDIVLDDKIRFHLKHLVLGLLCQADTPLDHEIRFVVQLADRPEWWEHVQNTVLWSKLPWFDALDTGGQLARWLSTWTDDGRLRMLVRLFRPIAEHRGERVDALLAPYFEAGGPWTNRFAELFSFDPADDSPGMSAIRIQKIRAGEWRLSEPCLDQLAVRKPGLVVPLIEATILSWIDRVRRYMRARGDGEAPRWEFQKDELDASVAAALRLNAARAWATFSSTLRLLQTLHRLADRRVQTGDGLGRRDWAISFSLHSAIEFVEKLVIKAVEGLAVHEPGEMTQMLRLLKAPKIRGLERAIAKGLVAGGDDLADAVVTWICDRTSRLHLGDGHEELYWSPAIGIIARFAPLCSEPVYTRLERVILDYHDEYETVTVRRQCECVREGHYDLGNSWGRAQNHLLHALPASRISQTAKLRASAWRTKFGDPAAERPLNALGGGGWVTSPIPPDKLQFVSDREWIRIIATAWPAHEGRRWKQHGPDVVGEASLRQFVDAFGIAAGRAPRRFARLALKIPPTMNPAYFASLLRAFANEQPSESIPENEPVSVQEVEAIVSHVGNCTDGEYVRSICWLIESRREVKWSDVMVNAVLSYIDHPEPGPDQFTAHTNKGPNGTMEPDVEMTAINCVRGNVAGAIRHLLWTRPDTFERLLPAVKRLIADSHPSVRIEAIGACLPIWNHEKELAVQLMLDACGHSDDNVLQSRWLEQMIALSRLHHLKKITPLLERMCCSSFEKVAEHGAMWAVANCLQEDVFDHRWIRRLLLKLGLIGRRRRRLAFRCEAGTVAQRIGASVAADQVYRTRKHTKAAAKLLKKMFNDESSDVRNRAGRVFRGDDVFSLTATPRLAEQFVRSRAFQDDPSDIFHPLTEFAGDLRPFATAILSAADVLAGPLAAASRDFQQRIGLAGNDLATVLMRLYESTYGVDRKIEKSCLDRWDLLLSRRVGMTERNLLALDI